MNAHHDATWFADAFGFGAEELAANRAGRLSAEQARGFAAVAAGHRRRSPTMLVVIAVLLVGGVVAGLVGSHQPITPGLVAAIVGIAAVPTVVLAVAVRANGRMVRAFEHPVVLVAEGPAITWTAYEDSYRLRIGEATFGVFADQMAGFRESQVYRAYYLDKGAGNQVLLSVEAVTPR